jgi:hypothetical protein
MRIRLFKLWIFDVYIPYTGTSPDNPSLLLMDKHGSHHDSPEWTEDIEDELFTMATAQGLHIMFYPPNASAFLQPLDQTFGTSKGKASFQVRVQCHQLEQTGGEMDHEQYIQVIHKAMCSAFSSVVTAKAWSMTGQWPIDKYIRHRDHVKKFIALCTHGTDTNSKNESSNDIITPKAAASGLSPVPALTDPALHRAKFNRRLPAPKLNLRETLSVPSPHHPVFRGDWEEVRGNIERVNSSAALAAVASLSNERRGHDAVPITDTIFTSNTPRIVNDAIAIIPAVEPVAPTTTSSGTVSITSTSYAGIGGNASDTCARNVQQASISPPPTMPPPRPSWSTRVNAIGDHDVPVCPSCHNSNAFADIDAKFCSHCACPRAATTSSTIQAKPKAKAKAKAKAKTKTKTTGGRGRRAGNDCKDDANTSHVDVDFTVRGGPVPIHRPPTSSTDFIEIFRRRKAALQRKRVEFKDKGTRKTKRDKEKEDDEKRPPVLMSGQSMIRHLAAPKTASEAKQNRGRTSKAPSAKKSGKVNANPKPGPITALISPMAAATATHTRGGRKSKATITESDNNREEDAAPSASSNDITTNRVNFTRSKRGRTVRAPSSYADTAAEEQVPPRRRRRTSAPELETKQRPGDTLDTGMTKDKLPVGTRVQAWYNPDHQAPQVDNDPAKWFDAEVTVNESDPSYETVSVLFNGDSVATDNYAPRLIRLAPAPVPQQQRRKSGRNRNVNGQK